MVGSLHQDKVERLQSAFSSTGKHYFWQQNEIKKWNQTNKLLKTEKNVRVCSTLYLAEQWQWPGRCPAVRLSQSQSAGRCSRPPAWPTAAGLVSVRPGITHTHTHSYLICSNEVNHRLGRVRLWFWRFSPASPPLCPCSRGWGTTRRTGSRGRRCFGCRSEWWSYVAAGWPGLNHNNIKCCLFNTRVV